MALFSKPNMPLDSRIAAVAVTSDPSDVKKIVKAQAAILGALGLAELLVWVAADINTGAVMALTTTRILDLISGSQLDYSLDGSRVAETSLGQRRFYGDKKHSFKHSMTITWHGGPLKHQSFKNRESSDMALFIERWEFDEVDMMRLSVDRQFGLA